MKKKTSIKPKTVKKKPKLKVAVKSKKKTTTVSKVKKQTALKGTQKAKKTVKVKKPSESKKTDKPIEKVEGGCRKCNRDKRLCKCGRPTKYEGDVTLTKTLDFLESCRVIVQREYKSESTKGTSYDISYLIDELPTKKNLAKHLGVNRKTIDDWMKANPEFSDIVENVTDEYEEMLVKNGLAGRFNPKITALLLSSKFGYAEKKDHRVETATGLFDNDEEDEE